MTNTDLHTHTEDDDCLFCMDHLEEAAMRILDPDIQQRVECHLARCPMCREELAQLEKTLQLLAFGVDGVEPRPEAKQELIARMEAERDQLPVATPVASTPKLQRASRSRISHSIPWSYGSMFAGLCVALLLIGAWNFLPFQNSNGDIPGGEIQVMAMELTCDDCHDETGGQIGADPKEKDGLVVAWNLDPQRKHEVWCVNRDGQHTKVGDLDVANTGSVMQTVSFPDEVGGFQQIYVIRDDGAQELTVAPGVSRENGDDSPPEPATPAE